MGGDHDRVHAFGRNDLAEMDVEAVAKGDDVARNQAGGDVLAVDLGLDLVGKENHDQVGLLGRFGGGNGLEAVFLGKFIIRPAGALSDNDVHARVAQVLGMGVALASVPDDGHGLVFQQTQVRIALVIDFHGISFVNRSSPEGARSVCPPPEPASLLIFTDRRVVLSPFLPVRKPGKNESLPGQHHPKSESGHGQFL